MIDRRHALIGLGVAASALAVARGLPAQAAPSALKKPPRLNAGDTVGLISPASPLGDQFDMALVTDTILAMELKPKVGVHALDRAGYLAGDNQFTLPVGVMAEIDAATGTIKLLEAAVA